MSRGSADHGAFDAASSLFSWKPLLEGGFPFSWEPPDGSTSEADYRGDSPLSIQKSQLK